ncbi:hypothetical protein VE00_00363 [Pseudogymnoascus sp. WSF 3629]|nr:hypothetical protein VE00_00363 [Pseudogymnoascus sp. WSF 3629]
MSSSTLTSASSASLNTLSTSTTISQNGSNVVATNNIINQRADASRSLYQICVSLRQRLLLVPGFEQHLQELDDDEIYDDDPVTLLWRCLRKGYPLMTIYNALQPPEPLQVDDKVSDAKKPKSAASKFVLACLKDLKLPPEEVFVLNDLFGDDTTGFVKVTQVLNVVLDVAEQRGLLLTAEAEAETPNAAVGGKMSYRDHVVRELVDTERKYVQDLENLHELKKQIEQKGVIPGDVVHAIFLNINAILDFQRRFLIRIETTNSQPDARQEWGAPFVFHEESFGIYQPFIANQRRAADIAKREFDKISLADHPVVVDFNTLDGFLLKPMQRLVKYPLLLKDLRDKTNADDQTKAELTAGMEASNRVLHQANDAVDRELRNEALVDLCTRVDDWKNHDINQFGDLLLHGVFTVITGKSDLEKEYTIYLFERILLCCKEMNPNKATKDKLMGGGKAAKDKKDKSGKTTKLQLKGRIFMTNVTDVVSMVKPGSYTVQIWWKGDPGIENFMIRFSHEEVMKKWSAAVDKQRKDCLDREQGPEVGTPEFAWMQAQKAPIQNPYAQPEDDDDDDDDYPQLANSGVFAEQAIPPEQNSFGMNRNTSSTSLRSRSTTGESIQSIAGVVRQAPPRFPMGPQPPLSLQTQMPLQTPPGTRGGDSYFSPVAESPASSRTSQNSMFPFPRQGSLTGNWEDHSRYTAPAIGRTPSRESQQSINYRNNPQRPSLPVMSSQQAQMVNAQNRSRSYSTPDINAQVNAARRRNDSQPVPAVPGIPPHLHPAYDNSIPRSSNGSPINGIPVRSATQSPGTQRDRSQPPQAGYPAVPPAYLRSNTTPVLATVKGGEDRTQTMSPPLSNSLPGMDIGLPTQLKVKVNCDGNYVTLVVAFNITYQSLIDRIDAKVGRFSNNAIARGTMRLRYQDEDGDYVTIESDDDIHIAFQEWREQQIEGLKNGMLGEIELFCASIE